MPAAKTEKKGDRLECASCGIVLVVDEACGCMEAHEIICCEDPMRKVRVTAKAKAKTKTVAKKKVKK